MTFIYLQQWLSIGEKIMTTINTNVGALFAKANGTIATMKMERAMLRLSSGLRINGAADDAAGLAVATTMKSQLLGTNMSIRNSADAVGLIQTAESGMNTVSNIVLRMRELAVQMNNGIYTASDRANASSEFNALRDEITKIATYTSFNSTSLLSGGIDTTMRAGDTNTQTIAVTVDSVLPTALSISSITLATLTNAASSVTALDGALSALAGFQAELGALQNRFEHTITNLTNAAMYTEQALGRIIDADFAVETSELSKQQILGQAATAMLAQANQSKQSVLALLQ